MWRANFIDDASRKCGGRADPRSIVTVSSAGNYVEFSLTDKSYLICGTLAGEEGASNASRQSKLCRDDRAALGR